MIAARAVAALLLVALSAVSDAQAPGGQPCSVLFRGVVRGDSVTTSMDRVVSGTGGGNLYISGGVDATCEGQGNRLLADSAEHFQDRGLLILYRNVRYTEARVAITSDKMFYYTDEERLVAEGNVRGRTASGTRFAGPHFEYLRDRPGIRPEPIWTAVGRPFVRMSPTETGAAPGSEADSVDLTANRVHSRNDSLVWASGAVVIERSDMRATSDSATLDQGTEFSRLLRDPKVVGKGERAFTMVGTVLDIWSRDRALERVLAAGQARVDSDSLVLTADTIDLRFADQRIQQVFTWGGRSRADGPEQEIEADSMDIRMPGQRLERLHAIGKAVAFSVIDTARIVSEERDLIAGDTIIAQFETVAEETSGGERTRMREVLAIGNARSFYQLAPSGERRGRPSLSYSRGKHITVSFTEGEMRTVTVTEQASGLFLEPADAVPADTTPRRGRRP